MAKKRTLTDVSLAKTLAVEALGSDSGYQAASRAETLIRLTWASTGA